MPASPVVRFHLDSPPPAAELPAGPVMLQGWALGADGRPFADLRVRWAYQTIPAVHGFLRADLARHFGAREPHLPAGFEACLTLPPGNHRVVFEGCDLAGKWIELGSISLQIQDSSFLAAPVPVGRISATEVGRVLRLILRQATNARVVDLAGQVAERLPEPAVTRFPHRPFHGHLHQPARIERAIFGRLRIEGWLFHETEEIRRVVATVDLQVWQTLEHGGELPYVAALFPDRATARASRICGLIDLPAQLPSPISVRVYAELADGTWHLCHVQRTFVTEGETEKAPYVPFSRIVFWQSCLHLRRTLARRGVYAAPDRSLWRELKDVYREFKERATQKRPAAPVAIARPTAGPSRRPAPANVTLVTHNLSYEGAPLFLFEFARYLSERKVGLHVISARDGPLADAYARLGVSVQTVDTSQLGTATDAPALDDGLRKLSRQVDLRQPDLVVANTLAAYWGVDLAHRAGIPSLFYIHESTTPGGFFLGHMAAATLPAIERTFTLASRVSFLTEATRRYYLPWLSRNNHEINPGWIELDLIDRYLAENSRSDLRGRLCLDESVKLVINVGAVCDRKGQHIFARAVDLLWRQQPELAAHCHFLMVGGRDTPFDLQMADLLHWLDRPNLRIIPETKLPLAYYGAADLFVCSSYEESFPRVILEAMACHVPILSTDVHGIPEMIRSGIDGLLVPPGNPDALCTGLASMLSDPARAKSMAATARQRVVENFAAKSLLPRHLALAADLARGSAESRE